MLALLRAHGTLVSWEPLAVFGRSVAVFAAHTEAASVKRALDRLVLEYEDNDKSILRVYFASETPLSTLPDGMLCPTRSLDGVQYLEPPPPVREFLISPPGSPPVGWEPVAEESPNTKTLAEDLMKALTRLAEEQSAEERAAEGPVLIIPESSGDVPSVLVHESEGSTTTDSKHSITETKTGIAGMHTARPPL